MMAWMIWSAFHPVTYLHQTLHRLLNFWTEINRLQKSPKMLKRMIWKFVWTITIPMSILPVLLASSLLLSNQDYLPLEKDQWVSSLLSRSHVQNYFNRMTKLGMLISLDLLSSWRDQTRLPGYCQSSSQTYPLSQNARQHYSCSLVHRELLDRFLPNTCKNQEVWYNCF